MLMDNEIPIENVCCKQDGGPAQFVSNPRLFLNSVFLRRWIRRRGSVKSPPGSPDFRPPNLFFLEYRTVKVHINWPYNLDDLGKMIGL